MEIPGKMKSQFDFEVESKNLDNREEYIEITFDLEKRSLYLYKRIGGLKVNEKTVTFCNSFI